jgi:hypothetical protein
MAKHATTTGRSASVLVGILCYAWVAAAGAAQAGSGSPAASPSSEVVRFPVRVMDFGNLAGPRTIVFRYTSLVPGAAGQAEILPGPTRWKLSAVFANLPPASRLGREYLTYVLWCVTPEGRSLNLGEVELTGTDAHLNTKVNLRRFGLIVTAEPYLAVSQPNKAVAFEADLAPGSSQGVSVTQVNCELLSVPIGAGTLNADPPRTTDPAEPLAIEEARRAIAVARAAGAEEYAPDTFGTAKRLLQLAEDQRARRVQRKDVVDTGSEAVFIAEDARVLAVTRRKRALGARAAGNHDASP